MRFTTNQTMNWKCGAFLATGFIVVSSLGLWAWNTVAGLVGAPDAQYKHIIAAMLLLFVTRLILAWPRRHSGVD